MLAVEATGETRVSVAIHAWPRRGAGLRWTLSSLVHKCRLPSVFPCGAPVCSTELGALGLASPDVPLLPRSRGRGVASQSALAPSGRVACQLLGDGTHSLLGQLVEFLKKVEPRGPLPCDAVLKIFYQTCRAVQHMHKQRPPIIHRDLKVPGPGHLASEPWNLPPSAALGLADARGCPSPVLALGGPHTWLTSCGVELPGSCHLPGLGLPLLPTCPHPSAL